MPSRDNSSFVVVANRLPVKRVKRGKSQTWVTSPGGLVSALKPILETRDGAWVGWTGSPGRAPNRFKHDGILNFPIAISRQEIDEYYEGFSNRTLWPLYHDAIRPPTFHRTWWRTYVNVNKRFAELTADVAAQDATVWVQDYHLQLVPRMLREQRPDLKIGFFLHIPFPPEELFAQIPWRAQVLEGLLGSDVVGFQTKIAADNFVRLAKRFTSWSGSGGAVNVDKRRVVARDFPISIDYERFRDLALDDENRLKGLSFRQRLGQRRKIILGVDRLDYTKGIEIRLRAYRELLETERVKPDEVVFVQIAVPSRETVTEYADTRANIERLVGEINGEYADVGRPAVHYLRQSFPQDELVALYTAADVMLVTPLCDGMNLVAKEYVAARTNNTGVLVLSEFTGSARELGGALLVNPHDIDGLVLTIDRALHMPDNEQERRITSMRKQIAKHDVYHWAETFLEAMAKHK